MFGAGLLWWDGPRRGSSGWCSHPHNQRGVMLQNYAGFSQPRDIAFPLTD